MAQEWAKSFYASTVWQKTRDAYIKSVFGLCEYDGCTDVGLILHHRSWLTPENINDMDIALGWDNLMFVCLKHHNLIHGIAVPYEDDEDEYTFNENGDLIPIERMID